jgi:hypothetical protein
MFLLRDNDHTTPVESPALNRSVAPALFGLAIVCLSRSAFICACVFACVCVCVVCVCCVNMALFPPFHHSALSSTDIPCLGMGAYFCANSLPPSCFQPPCCLSNQSAGSVKRQCRAWRRILPSQRLLWASTRAPPLGALFRVLAVPRTNDQTPNALPLV